MTKRRIHAEPVKRWTADEISTLRARYPHERSDNIARDLGKKLHNIYSAATRYGLKKSEAYLASPDARRLRRGGDDHPGRGTQFKPGQVSWNKGTHYQPGGRSVETRFKKGQVGSKFLPIGSERLMDGYLQRKVSTTGYPPRDWKGVHILLWEEHNGSVPPRHLISFRDGDRRHITLDNLELVSRAEHMKRHTVHNLPKELAQVVQLRGAVNRQINQREKRSAQK